MIGDHIAQYVDYVLKSVVAGLGGHEHEPIDYTVLVGLHSKATSRLPGRRRSCVDLF
jgi:hypothetical protein